VTTLQAPHSFWPDNGTQLQRVLRNEINWRAQSSRAMCGEREFLVQSFRLRPVLRDLTDSLTEVFSRKLLQ
jgi:hypothetical protein